MVPRVITSTSLFDGHDASINLFRRLLQNCGLEVIHLGHNRSVKEIVKTAVEEDADAVFVSSYQGGHMEFFRYLRQCLDEAGATSIQIFGGGGGTILPSEIQQLAQEGVDRLYHAEDAAGLGGPEGIVKDAISRIRSRKRSVTKKISTRFELAQAMTVVENEGFAGKEPPHTKVIGITGPGGAGKSSLVDEFVLRALSCTKDTKIAVVAVDPTKKKTGGGLLGDRIRMNSIYDDRVFVRSLATRDSSSEISKTLKDVVALLQTQHFDWIFVETTGIGQGSSAIVDIADTCVYVMTSEYGASTQLEKIEMFDYADVVVLNKFDKLGAVGALEDVRHAYANANGIAFVPNVELPIFATIASDFNNSGVSAAFEKIATLCGHVVDRDALATLKAAPCGTIMPPQMTFYLSEIADAVTHYKKETLALKEKASFAYCCDKVGNPYEFDKAAIDAYFQKIEAYTKETLCYSVRGSSVCKSLFSTSLSDQKIPKIAIPSYSDWGDIIRFLRLENFPGYFPFTAGVFALKNEAEDPKRQFAGEGGPARTNERFHFLCHGENAKRLSTAFDSTTLYGFDPAEELDIYGKVGNSGVSVATLDDCKRLYKGFDLTAPLTSVSMTINGPAPIILAMFLNTAIDFECEKDPSKKYEEVKEKVLQTVRGTVQADILKEEQAQNTCIFNLKFALKLMGDIQEYFIAHKVKNFYSVSISGYHIAEAGANPITQLAFTLANGFTYVEYYLSRGMSIDAITQNLSFFFSCGLDPEYTVLGRVARRIWAIAMKERYKASDTASRLKYHIQTSGRSLHAQEMDFNDIRTLIQAMIATFDNCNSLHTNSFDEAITTPTANSVRRAMAIQLILNKEFGMAKCQNPLQGSFFLEMLTDLVEEAVLAEFHNISRRGGVLGAIERQYQRHRIQSESMKYELLKASGELPVIGVNTFLSPDTATDYENIEVRRATDAEKDEQIRNVRAFIAKAGTKNKESLDRLRATALRGANIFEELMETVKYASLGQITKTLFSCGGQYRRSV